MNRLFGGGRRSMLLILVALAVLLPGAALAQSPNDERPTIAQRELLDQLGDQHARVYRSDTTGNVNLIGSTTKQDAMERPTALPANAPPWQPPGHTSPSTARSSGSRIRPNSCAPDKPKGRARAAPSCTSSRCKVACRSSAGSSTSS